MDTAPSRNHIVIAPQIYVCLESQPSADPTQETKPRRTEIPMVWIQDGENFRLDIGLPVSSVLDVLFSSLVESLYVNGETIWENHTTHPVGIPGIHAENTQGGLRLTCTSGGSIHILARCLLESNHKLPLNLASQV